MTEILSAPGENGLFASSPAITAKEIQTKFDTWEANGPVSSELVCVGHVALTPLDLEVLASRALRRMTYDTSIENTRLSNIDMRTAFLSVVKQDMERGELRGEPEVRTFGGLYEQRRHREPWHSDNAPVPSVRWAVAYGVGSTIGASGIVQKSDTTSTGDLRPEIAVVPGGQLEPVVYDEGSVVRFINSGDIHAGPYGNGPRIFMHASLRLY